MAFENQPGGKDRGFVFLEVGESAETGEICEIGAYKTTAKGRPVNQGARFVLDSEDADMQLAAFAGLIDDSDVIAFDARPKIRKLARILDKGGHEDVSFRAVDLQDLVESTIPGISFPQLCSQLNVSFPGRATLEGVRSSSVVFAYLYNRCHNDLFTGEWPFFDIDTVSAQESDAFAQPIAIDEAISVEEPASDEPVVDEISDVSEVPVVEKTVAAENPLVIESTAQDVPPESSVVDEFEEEVPETESLLEDDFDDLLFDDEDFEDVDDIEEVSELRASEQEGDLKTPVDAFSDTESRKELVEESGFASQFTDKLPVDVSDDDEAAIATGAISTTTAIVDDIEKPKINEVLELKDEFGLEKEFSVSSKLETETESDTESELDVPTKLEAETELELGTTDPELELESKSELEDEVREHISEVKETFDEKAAEISGRFEDFFRGAHASSTAVADEVQQSGLASNAEEKEEPESEPSYEKHTSFMGGGISRMRQKFSNDIHDIIADLDESDKSQPTEAESSDEYAPLDENNSFTEEEQDVLESKSEYEFVISADEDSSVLPTVSESYFAKEVSVEADESESEFEIESEFDVELESEPKSDLTPGPIANEEGSAWDSIIDTTDDEDDFFSGISKENPEVKSQYALDTKWQLDPNEKPAWLSERLAAARNRFADETNEQWQSDDSPVESIVTEPSHEELENVLEEEPVFTSPVDGAEIDFFAPEGIEVASDEDAEPTSVIVEPFADDLSSEDEEPALREDAWFSDTAHSTSEEGSVGKSEVVKSGTVAPEDEPEDGSGLLSDDTSRLTGGVVATGVAIAGISTAAVATNRLHEEGDALEQPVLSQPSDGAEIDFFTPEADTTDELEKEALIATETPDEASETVEEAIGGSETTEPVIEEKPVFGDATSDAAEELKSDISEIKSGLDSIAGILSSFQSEGIPVVQRLPQPAPIDAAAYDEVNRIALTAKELDAVMAIRRGENLVPANSQAAVAAPQSSGKTPSRKSRSAVSMAKPGEETPYSALPAQTEHGVEDVNMDGEIVYSLAGDFKHSPKSQNPIRDYLSSKGAQFSKDITLKCDYLILGQLGSRLWADGDFGSKVERAIELRESGRSNIRIVDEDSVIGDDFWEMFPK